MYVQPNQGDNNEYSPQRRDRFPRSPPFTSPEPQHQYDQYQAASEMDRPNNDYGHSGLPPSYSSSGQGDSHSESSFPDPASAAAAATSYQQQPQEVRTATATTTYSATATPTSEYTQFPTSARSATFSEQQVQQQPHHQQHTQTQAQQALQQHQQQQRSYHPATTHAGTTGDSSIPAPSPTAYNHAAQYSAYTPQDMTHGYAHPATTDLYAGHGPRPTWSNYGHTASPLTPAHPTHAVYHNAAATGRPQQQVYSFVPIPGAQQHKRPRRRFEEIDRMYKCGFKSCEKAYGTLNHLNAHVTMQGHGPKRVPDEFKEIRKEWKARKKEQESRMKTQNESNRAAAQAAQAAAAQNGAATATTDPSQPPSTYATARPVQLPPLGYTGPAYGTPTSAVGSQQPLPAEYTPVYPAPTAQASYPTTPSYGQQQHPLYPHQNPNPNNGQSNPPHQPPQ